MTPGAYLRLRRRASKLSIEDVAAALASEPRLAEHQRAELLNAIESGLQPAGFATIVALRRIYPFDLNILARLADNELRGDHASLPKLCHRCGCGGAVFCAADGVEQRTRWAAADLCRSCHRAACAAAEQGLSVERANGQPAASSGRANSQPPAGGITAL